MEYYHNDHLGNVRLAFSDLDGDGALTVGDIYDPTNEITQERHYYPFGLTHTGAWFATVAPEDAYRYNGKELDEATGLYDYGARYYDPAVARWGQIDPLAEQYAPYSPYNYVLGNPIRLIDPDGMRVDNTIFVDEDGNELYRSEDNLDDAVVIIKNENRDKFLAMSDAVQNTEEVNNTHIEWLRSVGDSYLTGDLNALWDKGQSNRHSAGYMGTESTIGDGSWIPEVSVNASRNSNGEVTPDWNTFEDHRDPTGNMNYYTEGTSFWHTHPEGDHYYRIRLSTGDIRRKKGSHKDGGPPSSADYNQIRGKNMNGHYNVAVLKTGYWFFNNQEKEFFIPRSAF